MTQLNFLRHLRHNHNLFYHTRWPILLCKVPSTAFSVVNKEMMTSCNSHINCTWVICISFFVLASISSCNWKPPSLYTRYSLMYEWNYISRHFHRMPSLPLCDEAVLHQCLLIFHKNYSVSCYENFSHNFCLTDFIDFYKKLTLQKYGAIWYSVDVGSESTVWCNLFMYNTML